MEAAAYHINWADVQQNIILPSCGYGVYANAGAAKSDGGEIEINYVPVSSLTIHASAGYEHARITTPRPGEVAGESLFLVPKWTESESDTYTPDRAFTLPVLGDARPYLSIGYNYVASRLSANSNPAFAVTLRSYGLLSAHAGLKLEKSELMLSGEDLTNTRVNLGDYPVIGWTEYSPSILSPATIIPTSVVGRPLTITLQYRYRYR